MRGSVIALALVSLAVGGMIYIVLRPGVPVFVDILADIGLDAWIVKIRASSLSLIVREAVPDVIVYSAPNAFWSFSYTLILMDIWWKNASRLRYVWLGTIPVFVLGWEFMQHQHLVSGTFCIEDLMCAFIGSVLAILIVIQIEKRGRYANSN